jgi:hypothetical protein
MLLVPSWFNEVRLLLRHLPLDWVPRRTQLRPTIEVQRENTHLEAYFIKIPGKILASTTYAKLLVSTAAAGRMRHVFLMPTLLGNQSITRRGLDANVMFLLYFSDLNPQAPCEQSCELISVGEEGEEGEDA